MKFESFDTNGEVFSTLKNDIITVIVLEATTELASFMSPVETVTIVSGTQLEWSLPEIDGGEAEVYGVQLDTDPLLTDYLKYNIKSNNVTYDGTVIAGVTRQTFVNVKITLINTAGENLYSQSIVIYLPLNDEVLSDDQEEEVSIEEIVSFDTEEKEEKTPENACKLQQQLAPKIGPKQTTEDYVDGLKESMQRARVEAGSRAGFSLEEISKLPEAYLTSISKNGEVLITFSKEINFPLEILRPWELEEESSDAKSRKNGAKL